MTLDLAITGPEANRDNSQIMQEVATTLSHDPGLRDGLFSGISVLLPNKQVLGRQRLSVLSVIEGTKVGLVQEFPEFFWQTSAFPPPLPWA